ncbi:DUF305 domain-containing protein [Nocardioides sp. SOB77]|uniref:DUF305 domain-containing protein n=1 Tax=Nocardioides oceani TaxID=3058369 RepID=A0ABT8FMG3_9ACTN|nr:DUF305 domain-containing protein [Nocardioides oceani]MDN4175866.1 DUF305 domain-containing protein [Nocardioides oceani]
MLPEKTPTPPAKQIEEMNKHHMHLLERLSGVDFDRHWITVVGGHHMAAIQMTETAMAGSASSSAAYLQRKLRQSQLEELNTLNDIHKEISD